MKNIYLFNLSSRLVPKRLSTHCLFFSFYSHENFSVKRLSRLAYKESVQKSHQLDIAPTKNYKKKEKKKGPSFFFCFLSIIFISTEQILSSTTTTTIIILLPPLPFCSRVFLDSERRTCRIREMDSYKLTVCYFLVVSLLWFFTKRKRRGHG